MPEFRTKLYLHLGLQNNACIACIRKLENASKFVRCKLAYFEYLEFRWLTKAR